MRAWPSLGFWVERRGSGLTSKRRRFRKRDQAQRDWERAQQLGPSEALAQSSYDAYKSASASAAASVTSGQAAILQARAAAAQAQASVSRARLNWDYCGRVTPHNIPNRCCGTVTSFT